MKNSQSFNGIKTRTYILSTKMVWPFNGTRNEAQELKRIDLERIAKSKEIKEREVKLKAEIKGYSEVYNRKISEEIQRLNDPRAIALRPDHSAAQIDFLSPEFTLITDENVARQVAELRGQHQPRFNPIISTTQVATLHKQPSKPEGTSRGCSFFSSWFWQESSLQNWKREAEDELLFFQHESEQRIQESKQKAELANSEYTKRISEEVRLINAQFQNPNTYPLKPIQF